MIKTSAIAAVFLAAVSGQAHALNARTWVSGTGVDSTGCGPIANPCRTLQFAHDQTNAGGEINFKDSAGYGSLTINKAINVVANGVLAGVLATSGNAVTVNAGATDNILLQGLTVEGANSAANGIVFAFGKTLEVRNTSVLNFSSACILVQPSAGTPKILMKNSTGSACFNGFVLSLPQANTSSPQIVIDGSAFSNNGASGIAFDINNSQPSPPTVNISDTLLAFNSANGLIVCCTPVGVFVDESRIEGNGGSALFVQGGGVTLSRSALVNNGQWGVYIDSGGAVFSTKDNRIERNAQGSVTGGSLTARTLQ